MEFAAFRREWREHPILHLSEEIPADLLSPVSVFMLLGGDKARGSFLLESVEAGENLGRYSIIGVDPSETVTLTETGGTLHTPTGIRRFEPREFLDVLRSRLPGSRPRRNDRDAFGLTGGWVGYFGYECARLFERLPSEARDVSGHPWAMLGRYNRIVLFDHVRQTARAIATVGSGLEPTTSVKRAYDGSRRELERILSRLRRPFASSPLAAAEPRRAKSNMSARQFHDGVRSVKRHIGRGDIFQGVLSQRFTVEGKQDAFQVYRRLRRSNPSPYMYFVRFGDLAVAGSSPETLVSKHGREVKTRPIAGTRPRGADEAEDLLLQRNLLASVKENAEHVMLVDLGRNDLGRVCVPGSVETKEFRKVDRYSHVMHIVSTVTGRAGPKVDSFDVLAAAFPAGTVTGAPKIRAMEIIDSIEPDRRGVYAGCVGYIDWYDDMDVAIAIRTAVIDHKGASVQAGAGIVADSDPEREYIETCNKAAAPLSAAGGLIDGKLDR